MFAFLFFGISQLTAQILNKPVPADNPNLAGNSPWTAACASASFNEYFVNFTWGPPLVNADNEFILELSDANGDFTSATELDRLGDQNTTFDFDFDFILPSDTRGENYRMRVRSTSPEIIGEESDPYPMYYIDFDMPLQIGKAGDNAIPPGGAIELCDGSSVSLEPFNISNANTYQYNWYRSGTLLSEKGPSLTTSQAGMYSVEIDYGFCSGSANTLSNAIDVTTGTSLGIAINPPAKTALCSGETQDLEANIMSMGLTYTWYKDGVAITTPTIDDHIYTVDASVAGFEGDYAVEISGSGTCLERSATVTMTNAGNFTVSRDNPENLVILPSQTQTLSVTTTATTPVYQWYKDGAPITGATNATLDITEAGVYFARVSQSGGACASTSVDSETTTAVSPASFELVVDYTTAYTACQNTSIALNVITVNAVAADNSRTDVTADLLASFSYQWQKDGVDVAGETSSIINITDVTENGSYAITGTLSTYNASSNNLEVQLLVNETIEISSTSVVFCNPADDITITTTTDLSSATFEWQRDGVSINTTDSALIVNQQGTYRLVVSRNGCPLPSNDVVIAPLDDSLISTDAPEDLVIPEGTTRTVTASGGTAYQWFDSNNNLLSDTSSVSLELEGNYMLVATIDNCQINKELTVSFLDTFRVPNVISANGDGINDQWVIPNSYSNKADVNVIIYNDQGVEILNEFNYQNSWPSASMAFPKQNMVFYYTIRDASEILKQGTITVIR